jgi:hypothetical protein
MLMIRILKLKPPSFVLATGLHPLVFETASHVATLWLASQPADVRYARTVVRRKQ